MAQRSDALYGCCDLVAGDEPHLFATNRRGSRVALLELVSPVLTRALEPFRRPVRTLDALHLASTEFLPERQPAIQLAIDDGRQAAAAKAMRIALYDLDAHPTRGRPHADECGERRTRA